MLRLLTAEEAAFHRARQMLLDHAQRARRWMYSATKDRAGLVVTITWQLN